MPLVVIVPCYGGLDRDTEAGLRELEVRGHKVWRVHGLAAIDQARSQLATDALTQGFDEIMWIDGDIVFNPGDIDTLRAHGRPFVAGVYAKKGKRAFALQTEESTYALPFGTSGGLFEVRYVGAGFMHTRASLYQKLAAELPDCNADFGEQCVPYFLPAIVEEKKGPWYLGEDYAFCERVRRAGIPVLVDTSIRLFHAGRYLYGWEDAGREVERFAAYTYTFKT